MSTDTKLRCLHDAQTSRIPESIPSHGPLRVCDLDFQGKSPHRYDDIIELPHHISQTHPQMSLHDRAAQFAPFAALTGYGAVIAEERRQTDRRVELDEDSKELLDEKMQMLLEQLERRPEVGITCFVPDKRKDGGSYRTRIGVVQKVDVSGKAIVMEDGALIHFDEVYDIEFIKVQETPLPLGSGCS